MKPLITVMALFIYVSSTAQIDNTVPLQETLDEFNDTFKDIGIEIDDESGTITLTKSEATFKFTDLSSVDNIKFQEQEGKPVSIIFERGNKINNNELEIDKLDKNKRQKLLTILKHLYKSYVNKKWVQDLKSNQQKFF